MKTCLECEAKIIGREDKKFCSDSCRNSYNNKMKRDNTNLMRNVNNILRKNYSILCNSNIEGKTNISKQKLINLGFSFEYFTSILNTKTGNTYYFIYDQGYKYLEKEYVMLVKKTTN